METTETIIKLIKDRYITAYCNPDFKGDKYAFIFDDLPQFAHVRDELIEYTKFMFGDEYAEDLELIDEYLKSRKL